MDSRKLIHKAIILVRNFYIYSPLLLKDPSGTTCETHSTIFYDLNYLNFNSLFIDHLTKN